ncbi:MAG: amino acid adenylation domain-containing protein [Desulfobacteraceae bacterium]|nr:MAG: amino acid adenylation domain-containing protein [Desulfobacteraceae bacterium]
MNVRDCLYLHHFVNPAQLFRVVVEQYANRPAIAFGLNNKLQYEELDRISNRVARFLLDTGVQKGDRIGLCLEKSSSFYALLLAALKVGAPYFALDPRNPDRRAESIIEQCRPRIVFSHEPLAACPGTTPNILCPEGSRLPDFCHAYSEKHMREVDTVCGSDPAYIMFTSGSTGTPKGAVISHDNLLHFIGWAAVHYGFTPEDVHTHLNAVYFDNSVFDVFSTLFTGGQLVPFTQKTLLDPSALAHRLKEMSCTIWFSVPSLLIFAQIMKIAVPEYFATLRKIIFGGEGFPKPKLEILVSSLGPGVEYHNVSGPTECTCICSSYCVTDSDFKDLDGLPPLGTLIPNFKGYILDGDQPSGVGKPGELCLSGPCVGLGYYAQPELTQQSFVQNPLNTAYREVIYRTGDLVKINPSDRKLYFIGRKDLQIKHMGYRIELEEIQHALSLCGDVDEATVLYRHVQQEIVAVIAAQHSPDMHALRTQLGRLIPKYMMPSKYHLLKTMPKTANGKTDRQALVRQYAK